MGLCVGQPTFVCKPRLQDLSRAALHQRCLMRLESACCLCNPWFRSVMLQESANRECKRYQAARARCGHGKRAGETNTRLWSALMLVRPQLRALLASRPTRDSQEHTSHRTCRCKQVAKVADTTLEASIAAQRAAEAASPASPLPRRSLSESRLNFLLSLPGTAYASSSNCSIPAISPSMPICRG